MNPRTQGGRPILHITIHKGTLCPGAASMWGLRPQAVADPLANLLSAAGLQGPTDTKTDELLGCISRSLRHTGGI